MRKLGRGGLLSIGAALVLAGCGPGGAPLRSALTPAPSSSPTRALSTPSPRRPVLLAVLEARGPGSRLGDPGGASPADTVAIVGLDGYARARATFAPRALPAVGAGTPVLEPAARVADGAVYYMDGQGVVRRLAVGSPPRQVAVFPIANPQDEVSFAVSPDGSSLVASSLQLPGLAPPGPGHPTAALDPSAPWTESLLRARAGGATQTVWTKDLGTGAAALSRVTVVAGWDRIAPVALLQAVIGTQQAEGGRLLDGAQLVNLDAIGEASEPIGGADCQPWSELPDQKIVCVLSDLGHASVRDATGRILWTPPAGCIAPAGPFPLAPDGTRLICTAGSPSSSVYGVFGKDGTLTTLPAGFRPQGWLDAHTLVGVLGTGSASGDLGTLRLGAKSATDLGFKGIFIGVESGPS